MMACKEYQQMQRPLAYWPTSFFFAAGHLRFHPRRKASRLLAQQEADLKVIEKEMTGAPAKDPNVFLLFFPTKSSKTKSQKAETSFCVLWYCHVAMKYSTNLESLGFIRTIFNACGISICLFQTTTMVFFGVAKKELKEAKTDPARSPRSPRSPRTSPRSKVDVKEAIQEPCATSGDDFRGVRKKETGFTGETFHAFHASTLTFKLVEGSKFVVKIHSFCRIS